MIESVAQSTADPLIGTTLGGRYQIIRRIGEGGMGIVYEAQHVVIQKPVAVKVLRDDSAGRPENVARFRQEAISASRIGHENIIDISDFGQTPQGYHYFVMEMLKGEDLADVLEREQALDIPRAVNITLQCCRALGAAHAKGIVHRDMKPENIFLTKRTNNTDFVKIVDFGIAKMNDLETSGPGRKLTKTGMIFGTPEYMSPEQAGGKPLDHRVDIYALGLILYEMVTGSVPFTGDNFMGILTQHMFEKPPPLKQINATRDYDPDLEAVIFRAIAKERDKRFTTMEEFADDLSLLFGTNPGVATSMRSLRTKPRSASRSASKKGLLWGAALTLIAAGGAVAWQQGLLGKDELSSPADLVDVSDLPTTEEPAVDAGVPDPSALGAKAAEDKPADTVVQVWVTVQSKPLGAQVSVEGRGVICSAGTESCRFQTPAGELLQVVAEHDGQRESRELRPTTASTLEFDLLPPRRSKPTRRRRKPTAKTKPRAKKPTHDLKTPSFFK